MCRREGDIVSGTTYLFIGDSITECNRLEPDQGPLGTGYVKMICGRRFAPQLLSSRLGKSLLARHNRRCRGMDAVVVWNSNPVERSQDE